MGSLRNTVNLVERYLSSYSVWNVRQIHSWYRREGGLRSYTWPRDDYGRLRRRGAGARISISLGSEATLVFQGWGR